MEHLGGHRPPSWSRGEIRGSAALLALAGLAVGLGISAAAAPAAPPRAFAESHLVRTAALPKPPCGGATPATRSAACRLPVVPVDPGGRIVLRLTHSARRTVVHQGSRSYAKTVRSGGSRRRWIVRLPRRGEVPRSVRVRVRYSSGRVGSYGLALRRHEHRYRQHVAASGLAISWAFRPRSVAALVKEARIATRATVVGVADGPRLFSEAYDDPGIPTQRITLSADRRIYGRVPKRFVLFKTGSSRAWGHGDPPYAVGERYLIFATRRPENDGTFLNAGPDGRIRVVGGGVLESLIQGRTAQTLAGLTVGEAAQIARRARGA